MKGEQTKEKEKGERKKERGKADVSQINFVLYLFAFAFLKPWQNQPGILA
jgi:hypothetical protein